MKLVLCSLTSQYIHSSLAPWCLLAGMKRYSRHPMNIRILEGTINESPAQILARLGAEQPDVVGFSCYIWNITLVQWLAAALRQRFPDCRVFFGGPEVSYRPQDVLKRNPAVDAVVSGEGEYPVSCLADVWSERGEPEGLPGISYRKKDSLIIAEPYLTAEEPPSPYLPEYFSALNGRIAYLETSRGCPFSCAFCLSGRCGGVRFYPMERVKRELILLANSGTQTVKLVDRTFNADRSRARDIFSFLIDHYGKDIPTTVCFHFEIAGDLLDNETLELLSTAPAGLFQMEIGLQSFHSETLTRVCRKTNLEYLKTVIGDLVSMGNIHIHIDLIAGLPEEGLSSFAEGFNIAFSLKPHMLQLGFLKLLYGAAMREQPEAYPCRYSLQAPYEVLETPWLTEEDLLLLHGIADALDRMYNKGRFQQTLSYLMQATGETAFSIFESVARYNAGRELLRISLDEYTQMLIDCFENRAGIDPKLLLDALVCDRLTANPSGLLPDRLRRCPDAVKSIRRQLDTNPRYCRHENVRRACACLSDGQTFVYTDCQDKNPVTGLYPLHYYRRTSPYHEYRVILWDLDGTLTDPAEGITNSVAYALDKFGITVADKNTLTPFIGPPLLDSFREFYHFKEEQARQALSYYREYYIDQGIYENVVYKGIPELLRDLRHEGYCLALATSKPEIYARRVLYTCCLSKFFTVICGSDLAEKRVAKELVIKDALTAVADRYPGSAVMIGDRKFDILGATHNGIPGVGVLYGYGSEEELRRNGVCSVARTVDDLRKLFL